MKSYKPELKKVLFAVFVLWVIGISCYIIEIYVKLGNMEHELCHIPFLAHCPKH